MFILFDTFHTHFQNSLPLVKISVKTSYQLPLASNFCKQSPQMMGPSCGRRTRKSTARRRTHFKKHIRSFKDIQEKSAVSPANSPVTPSAYSLQIEGSEDMEVVDGEMSSSSSCSTPKAERFRIPEIKTCPPAPKKRRIITSCSFQRTPIAFFNPPDIELFFYLALRGVSA